MSKLPVLDPRLIEKINREHLIRTPIRQADLLFVFGTTLWVPEYRDVIDDLWSRRLFSRVLVTGGVKKGSDASEACMLSRGMQERGIPADIIIEEHAAANTGENVELSLPLIDARIGLENVRSLIAVGKYYASSRYLMTLERHWPNVEKMFAPVHLHAHPPDRWHEHAELREEVLREWEKLARYKANGFIVDWPPRT